MPESPDTGTFYPLVWSIVRQVPYGVVSTYGQIASIIPTPPSVEDADYHSLGAKWVGEALNAVSFQDIDGQPVQPGVPWWRIINSRGGISMPAGSGAAAQQRTRLSTEGVQFDARGLVSLDEYGWDGPPQAWLDEHGLLKPKSLRSSGPRQMSLF